MLSTLSDTLSKNSNQKQKDEQQSEMKQLITDQSFRLRLCLTTREWVSK